MADTPTGPVKTVTQENVPVSTGDGYFFTERDTSMRSPAQVYAIRRSTCPPHDTRSGDVVVTPKQLGLDPTRLWFSPSPDGKALAVGDQSRTCLVDVSTRTMEAPKVAPPSMSRFHGWTNDSRHWLFSPSDRRHVVLLGSRDHEPRAIHDAGDSNEVRVMMPTPATRDAAQGLILVREASAGRIRRYELGDIIGGAAPNPSPMPALDGGVPLELIGNILYASTPRGGPLNQQRVVAYDLATGHKSEVVPAKSGSQALGQAVFPTGAIVVRWDEPEPSGVSSYEIVWLESGKREPLTLAVTGRADLNADGNLLLAADRSSGKVCVLHLARAKA